MVKRLIKPIYYLSGVVIILLLVFNNLDSFVDSTNRFKSIFSKNELETFFDIFNKKNFNIYEESLDHVSGTVDSFIENFIIITDQSFFDIIKSVVEFLLINLYHFIIYFCNFGINIILIFYFFLKEKFNGTQTNIKTTIPAQIFIKISNFIRKIMMSIFLFFKKLLSFIHNRRRTIVLHILLILLASGIMYFIFTEVVIFIIVYIIKTINLETYLVIFSVIKTLYIVLWDRIGDIPSSIFIPITIAIIFLNAYKNAVKKLLENHRKLKQFAKEELTQTTFINGAPGTGKTLLNVSLTLASEENYIEELEEFLLQYELRYKYINFALVREKPEDFPQHIEYIRHYNFLNERNSFIISNYSIFSPLYNDFSKIFNFDYMRVNQPSEFYPLEEYIILSLSEFDKEYNSHDNKKEVGEEGASTFFSTVSHDQKRHIKIFVDYQLKDQVPLRIRGNAEYFLTVKKRKKKFPLLLRVYYLPFQIVLTLVTKYIKKYELKKKNVSRKSTRKSKAVYKRNDLSLPYIILRSLASKLTVIKDFFEQFYYFKLYLHLFQEGDSFKPMKRTLSINLRDLKHKGELLYDSTFLSFIYEQKKNKKFKDIEKFTKLAPSKDELSLCNSRFYNKINH